MKQSSPTFSKLFKQYRLYSGIEAYRFNSFAINVVADYLKSSIGPFGKDKVILGEDEITLTKDGYLILDNLSSFSPAVELLKGGVKALKQTVGDGTHTAVILAGALLMAAEKLLTRGLSSSTIIEGFTHAHDAAQRQLESLSEKFDLTNRDTVLSLVTTVLSGSGLTSEELRISRLPNLIVEAVSRIAHNASFDLDDVKVVGTRAGSPEDSSILKGVVLKPTSELHPAMPRLISDPRVALVNVPVGSLKTATGSRLELSAPESMRRAKQKEDESGFRLVAAVINAHANVVFCSRRIDEKPLYKFAARGILAVPNISHTDMKRLVKTTGAQVVANINDLSSETVGRAQLIEERRIGFIRRLFVVGEEDSRAVTLFLPGSTKRATVATRKALKVVRATLHSGLHVVGGGAAEFELARRIKDYAMRYEGKQQLAILAFADALKTPIHEMFSNCGADVLDASLALSVMHAKGDTAAGFDFDTRQVRYGLTHVLESFEVKRKTMTAALELVLTVLAVDGVLVNEKILESKGAS